MLDSSNKLSCVAYLLVTDVLTECNCLFCIKPNYVMPIISY